MQYMMNIEEEKEKMKEVQEVNSPDDYDNAQFHTVDSAEKQTGFKIHGHKSSLPELPF